MTRLRSLAPLLFVLAVVAVQFAPVLAGRVYRFEDIAAYFEPLWTAAARAMRAGRWPAWDGGAWSGQPIAGDPQAGIFYPPHWLWLALPVLRAYAVMAMLHALGAGLGMYVLVRVRGGSRAAAALAGVALGAGGYVVLQVRHIMFVEATAWIPWTVAAGWKLVETGRPLHLAGLAAAAGMLLLTGGVSMVYYGSWFIAAVLLPHALARTDAGRPRWRSIGLLALGGGLGLLLAAPVLVPAAAHGALSPRALGADEHFAASVAWSGLHLLPSLFVPNLLGQEVRGDYLGGGTQWEIAGYYPGMLTVALGVAALFAGRRERRAERITLGLLLLLCVLLAVGARSPLHHIASRLLPLYSTMRCPPRALYVFALAMPMMAADGLDRLAQYLRARRMSERGSRVAVPILVALDLLVTHRAENPSTTLAAAHAQAFPDVVAYLRDHLRPGDRYVNDVHLRHDLHNSGLLWDLPGAGGYSSLPLWRYLHLLWISNHGGVYPHARLHDDLAAQGLWKFDSPIVDLLGVRLVLAPKGWDPHATGYSKRFEGAHGIDVWENSEALPRAWMVYPGPRAEAGRAGSITDPGFDPWSQLIEEDAAGVSRDLGSGRRERDPQAVVVALAPGEGELEVRALARRDGRLVISQPAHPGWRALVDGRPAAVEVADYALVAVELPAGSHVVRLRMTSRPLNVGLALGGSGIVCLLGVALLGRRRGSNRLSEPRPGRRTAASGPR